MSTSSITNTDVAYQNAKRKIWLSDTGLSPTIVEIPTLSVTATPAKKDEKFYLSTGVNQTTGAANEDGAITGVGMTYKVETKQFQADSSDSAFAQSLEATPMNPPLCEALQIIQGCQDQVEAAARLTFVIQEPNGKCYQEICAVSDVVMIEGKTEDLAAMKWTMERRGPRVAFTGTLPTD
jgi:hypothetical protein